MLINKITIGFVIQSFDTEKEEWVGQEFVAGDEVTYEDSNTGEEILCEEIPFCLDVKPCLSLEMIQP